MRQQKVLGSGVTICNPPPHCLPLTSVAAGNGMQNIKGSCEAQRAKIWNILDISTMLDETRTKMLTEEKYSFVILPRNISEEQISLSQKNRKPNVIPLGKIKSNILQISLENSRAKCIVEVWVQGSILWLFFVLQSVWCHLDGLWG